MNNAPSVKCPVHGEHGALSNGRCWYCVMAGITPVVSAQQKTRQISGRATVPVTRRIG